MKKSITVFCLSLALVVGMIFSLAGEVRSHNVASSQLASLDDETHSPHDSEVDLGTKKSPGSQSDHTQNSNHSHGHNSTDHSHEKSAMPFNLFCETGSCSFAYALRRNSPLVDDYSIRVERPPRS
jgi:hypothetical protein